MNMFLCFLAGLLLGGTAAAVILCCLAISRVSEYETEIRSLRSKLNKK